jgi:sugar O-acyltransferase (sialic acid O-acetyltransferase NeuD family)
MRDIIIIGAGGFGKEVAWLIEQINRVELKWNLLGFIDDFKPVGESINGAAIIGDLSWLKDKSLAIVCSISNPSIRKKIVQNLESTNNEFVSLIHPKVELSKTVNIGRGTIICEGVKFTVNIEIGHHVIIYHDSVICHDARIEDYCSILPSVNISGNVHIKDGTTLGTGSKVIQNIQIGSDVIVGAGAVVVKDVPDNVITMGVPAKIKI